jgi:hypothetical protein
VDGPSSLLPSGVRSGHRIAAQPAEPVGRAPTSPLPACHRRRRQAASGSARTRPSRCSHRGDPSGEPPTPQAACGDRSSFGHGHRRSRCASRLSSGSSATKTRASSAASCPRSSMVNGLALTWSQHNPWPSKTANRPRRPRFRPGYERDAGSPGPRLKCRLAARDLNGPSASAGTPAIATGSPYTPGSGTRTSTLPLSRCRGTRRTSYSA